MLRFLKFLLILVVIAAAAIFGYAYIGDLTPETEEVREPVSLDNDG